VSYAGLPPLFGMLIAGFVLQNFIPDQLNGISASTNSTVRTVALGIIMLRAGMGLNISKLRENSATTLLLSCVPCVCEAATIALIAKLLFPILTIPFAFMLGCVIADVSPAVTTPILLDFMSQGLGVDKGIPSILLAAGSVNSVVAIVLYNITNNFAWSSSVQANDLIRLVGVDLILQVVGVGGIVGWLLGRFTELCWRMTSREHERFFILFFMAMMILFGFKQVDMSGGGTLAVVTCGATLQNTIKDKDSVKPVSDLMARIWQSCGSVMLFTLLGASVDQSKLEGRKVGFALVTILIGLVGRSLACFGTVSLMREWNKWERAFAMVSWCPKATVQAALATVARDYVKSKIDDGSWDENDPYTRDMLDRSNVILTTAVLSIVVTAPAFAVLMVWTGNRWLHRSNGEQMAASDNGSAENQNVHGNIAQAQCLGISNAGAQTGHPTMPNLLEGLQCTSQKPVCFEIGV